MEKPNILSRLKRGFYSTMAVGSMLGSTLSAYACGGDNPVEPKTDNPPQITAYVSPTSGMVPVNVGVGVNCTDDIGIKAYRVMNGSETTSRTSPIDTIFTYTQPGTYTATTECEDTGGHIARYGPVTITASPRPAQNVSQTATLENYVDIKIDINKENTDSLRTRVLKDGTPIDSFTVRTSPFTKTLTSNPVGNYNVVSTWKTYAGKDTSVTTGLGVPFYGYTSPDFSAVPQPNIDEEDSTKTDLPRADAKNPEKKPVRYISAKSLDGKTVPTIGAFPNDTVLSIKAVPDSTGDYQIELTYGDGQTGKATINGRIYDLPRLRGTTESNEDHGTGIQSTLVAYEVIGSDTLRLETSTSDGSLRNVTDINGNFDFKIKKRSTDLEKIILMTRLGTLGNYLGPVRVIEIPAKDASGLLIRAVPCAPYCSNFNDFNQFMRELAGDSPNTRFDFTGEYLHQFPGFENFNGLERIRILDHYYFGDPGTLTLDQQNNIKNKTVDTGDISGVIGDNVINPNIIVFGNDSTFTDYTLDSLNQKIIPKKGVVIFAPRMNLPNGVSELTEVYGSGTFWGGVIYLNGGGSNATISHGSGHWLIGSGHPTIFGSTQTVMNASADRSTMGPADKKAGKIIYEPRFMIFPLNKFPGVDNLNKILRNDFK